MIRTTALACGLLLLAQAQAEAVTTRTFVTSSYKNFEAGEGDGVLILSSGEVTPGPSAKRLDVGAAFVRSALAVGQRVVLGTGDDGELWLLEGGKVRKLAQLPEAIEVTALAAAPGGDEVYAGTTPGGRIFAVRLPDGKVRELVRLPAEHIWTLGWDAGKKELLVGTGTPGKIFTVDAAGKHKAIWDSGQKHVRSVVESEDGSLVVGTAPEAILFRVRRDGTGRALHDFEGEEVRALTRFGGSTYVAINAFAAQPAVTTPAAGTTPPTKITPTLQPPSRKAPPAGKTQRPGKAAVYRMDAAGRVEQVHSIANGYFTALHVEKGGDLLAASGEGGRVYRIRPDRTVVTLFDFPERQVLAIAYEGATRLLATGDAGAVYQVSEAPHQSPTYLSEVFTTEFPARFGRLDWRGRGKVAVETRTGNTKRPDKTWSAWERIKAGGGDERGGAVVSPEGRYFQYRLKLAQGAAVREVVAHYHAQNQPPRVVELTAATSPSGGATGGTPPSVTLGGRDRQSQVRLSWRVENPDKDNLTYRVSFREEEEKNWRPLGGPEPLTKPELTWNTEGVPDGHYVVRVVASDETSNPIGEALSHELVGEPFLVDNRSPEIQGLKVSFADGGTPTVSGQARDSFSRISEIAYSVDGGDWHLVAPSDGLFDERSEAFSFRASEKLAPGAHTIAIRAADSVGNLGATAARFRTK